MLRGRFWKTDPDKGSYQTIGLISAPTDFQAACQDALWQCAALYTIGHEI